MERDNPPAVLHIAPLPALDKTVAPPTRPGDLCPRCGAGRMDYNGLLELECVKCSHVISGGGGCT